MSCTRIYTFADYHCAQVDRVDHIASCDAIVYSLSTAIGDAMGGYIVGSTPEIRYTLIVRRLGYASTLEISSYSLLVVIRIDHVQEPAFVVEDLSRGHLEGCTLYHMLHWCLALSEIWDTFVATLREPDVWLCSPLAASRTCLLESVRICIEAEALHDPGQLLGNVDKEVSSSSIACRELSGGKREWHSLNEIWEVDALVRSVVYVGPVMSCHWCTVILSNRTKRWCSDVAGAGYRGIHLARMCVEAHDGLSDINSIGFPASSVILVLTSPFEGHDPKNKAICWDLPKSVEALKVLVVCIEMGRQSRMVVEGDGNA
ncbi:hypothetical protein Tco_0563531 [Tanacetum coccineum]